MIEIYRFLLSSFSLFRSRSSVSGVGRSIVYCGTKSPIWIQRKPLHIHGNLQRISSYLLPQRFYVSFFLSLLIFCLHFSFLLFPDNRHGWKKIFFRYSCLFVLPSTKDISMIIPSLNFCALKLRETTAISWLLGWKRSVDFLFVTKPCSRLW